MSDDNNDDDDIDDMEQTLTWIGFNTISSRDALQIDIEQFEDMLELAEKDISDIEYSYLKRTAADGRLIFGLQKTKRLKSMMHWVQYFAIFSKTPNTDDLDEASFRAALGVAAQRPTIRKQEEKDASSVSIEASPGKLKDNRKWNKCILGFENMLSTILGVIGVPLSYRVRENPEPTPEGCDTFVQKFIACAPLTGPHFVADARRVHQLAASFTQGYISEQWIINACKKTKRLHRPRSFIRAL